MDSCHRLVTVLLCFASRYILTFSGYISMKDYGQSDCTIPWGYLILANRIGQDNKDLDFIDYMF